MDNSDAAAQYREYLGLELSHVDEPNEVLEPPVLEDVEDEIVDEDPVPAPEVATSDEED